MNLSPAMEAFVRHWGEMGARWGVNRSIAQMHALLYLSDRALPADEIADTLGIARSNVSSGLRELQNYQLVELEHMPGDRRDHFRAKPDPWDVMFAIIEERKRREIDPALALVRTSVAAAETDGVTPTYAQERLNAMLDLLQELDDLYGKLRKIPRSVLRGVTKLGEKITRML
ncbi:MAG: GbsR/MarR family transcriptional regulator [Dongiaceae bacterium]